MISKLQNLEKLINSELSSKVQSSSINNEDLLIEINDTHLIDTVKFLKLKGHDVKMLLDLYTIYKPRCGDVYVFKACDIPSEHSDTIFLADELIKDLENITSTVFYHISFLRPHPPMFVSEPWHSLINPNDIELPKENHTYEELLDDHPLLKEIARKLCNAD